MLFNKNKFGYKTGQVLFFVSLLRGAAQDWIQPYLQDYLANKHRTGLITNAIREDTKSMFRSIVGFSAAIRQVFGDIEEKHTALRGL